MGGKFTTLCLFLYLLVHMCTNVTHAVTKTVMSYMSCLAYAYVDEWVEWVKLLCEQVHLFGGMFEILVGFVYCSIQYVAVHCLCHSLGLCSRDRYGRKFHAHRTQVHVPLYYYWGVGVDVMESRL